MFSHLFVIFETTQVRNARKKPQKVQGKILWPAPFHILSMFPHYANPNARSHTYPGFVSTPLQEVKQIDYLGLRLDPMLTMKPALASIQEKANKGHSLALAVSYSLQYDKHHSNSTLCHSPVKMLNLWKSCVLPHFYSTFATFLMLHKSKRYRPVSTDLLAPPCMSMATHRATF